MTRRSGKVLVAVLLLAGAPGVVLARAGAGLPGQPLDENKALQELEQEVKQFDDAQRDYKYTVRHVVQQEYSGKRKALTDKYQAQIDAIDKEERLRRGAAIVLFENFLSKYSHDDRWTPDAMFRLAELYFEKNNDEYLTATANGASGITPDYNKTIDIYKDLIARFPAYRLLDGAFYLMGYCLKEMGKDGESLQAFRALVCKNKYNALDPAPPSAEDQSRIGSKETEAEAFAQYASTCEPVKKDSRFLAEGWIRIGEYHFDRASEIRNNVAEQNKELARAEAAYIRVLDDKDSPLYDKALYKLAWSYYRHDKYTDAVKRFDDLVIYSDKRKSDTGKEGSDLRTESVQYLGVSFSEPDWGDHLADDSGLARIEQFYRGRWSEQHVKEIYARLGDVYFDKADFPRAIAAYKKTLERWPNDPDGPKLQDRIVRIYETLHNEKKAFEERERLVANYTNEKSDWYKHNRDNKEAIDTANELAEFTLQKVAADYQNDALDRRKKLPPLPKHDDPRYKAAKLQRNSTEAYRTVRDEYAKAAQAWEVYLAKYPNSKEWYEYSFAYAEALYYAERFLDAAKQYELVRDSKLDNKYAEDSAYSVTKSYESFLEDQSDKGKMAWPPTKPETGKVALPITPIPYPEVVDKLLKAYDIFAQRVPTSPRVPAMSYKATEVAFNYLHWDDMRPRAEALLDKYCKDEIGGNAGSLILNSYTIENNLDKIQEWGSKLQQKACGKGDVTASVQNLGKIVAGARFNKAEKLFNEGKCEEAAPLYEQIVDANPKDSQADAALNNAALCYAKTNRYAAATKTYERIVNEYPNSAFVDEALFLTAASYQRAFDFDAAVRSYQRLAEDKKFVKSTHRLDALYNAALLLEFDQNYSKAAELYKRYAVDKAKDTTPPKPLKPGESPPPVPADAAYSAAFCLEKLKDYDGALKAYRDYLAKYNPPLAKVLQVNFKLAEIYEAKKDRRSADDQYKKVVALGRGAKPASEEAEFPAHAAFILAEQGLPSVEKVQISQNPKQFQNSLKKLQEQVDGLYKVYEDVTNYRRASWVVAGRFRQGYLREFFSRSLRAVLSFPCPADIQRQFKEEGCNLYQQKLAEQIEPQVADVDKLAVQDYGTTLEVAGKLGVSNDWTRLARQHANSFDPQKFPLTKDEHIDMQLENP